MPPIWAPRTASVRRRNCSLIPGVAFFIGWVTILGCWFPAVAEPQGQAPEQMSSAQQQSDDDQEEPEYNGQDFTRPQRSLETRLEYRTSSGTTSRTDRGIALERYTSKIKLGTSWKLGFLAQVPFVDKTTKMFDPSSLDNEAGIGDSAFQAALIHTIDPHWAYGFGARLVTPTAEDALGSGKWQIMPGLGVRYSFLEIGPDTYFVPVVRYAMSFAGDPTRRNISEAQIAATLNIGLPDRWFLTFYPSYDIRINFGDPISGQTGRLFFPFDIAVGRNITENLMTSLEVSVPIIKDYPVYNFKAQIRLNVVY